MSNHPDEIPGVAIHVYAIPGQRLIPQINWCINFARVNRCVVRLHASQPDVPEYAHVDTWEGSKSKVVYNRFLEINELLADPPPPGPITDEIETEEIEVSAMPFTDEEPTAPTMPDEMLREFVSGTPPEDPLVNDPESSEDVDDEEMPDNVPPQQTVHPHVADVDDAAVQAGLDHGIDLKRVVPVEDIPSSEDLLSDIQSHLGGDEYSDPM